MNIGFDCKRAFSNNTGLGNYSRDTINLLSNHYPNEQYFLFTPKFTKNKRIEFIKKKENLFIRTPISNTNKIFKSRASCSGDTLSRLKILFLLISTKNNFIVATMIMKLLKVWSK